MKTQNKKQVQVTMTLKRMKPNDRKESKKRLRDRAILRQRAKEKSAKERAQVEVEESTEAEIDQAD